MIKFESVKFGVSFLREGDTFIAYSPALDLSTCGDTLEEAKQRFAEIVRIFFAELKKMGTLDQALNDLGWKKKGNHFLPPMVVAQELTSVALPTRQLANA